MSTPPLWLRNWAALNGLAVVEADIYVVGHRGDWYIGMAPDVGCVFQHNDKGFYVWKRITKTRFLASYAATHPRAATSDPEAAVGRLRLK